ncbi:MAG: hypothetical protein KJT03_05350 [Verrucomicrobiae bacterium]|nr:hypothetical protein [Verrucomicrobiae bacterium]
MINWWNSLQMAQQIFYGIGIIALMVTVIQLFLTMVGIGGDAMDFDLDLGTDSHHSSGVGIFSMQTLAAFFLAFGWAGVVGINSGLSLVLTVILAGTAGLVMMFVMYKLIRAFLHLQAKGNLEYSSAVGQTATVYVTIPGSNQDGGGQIQVNIQGRLTTASARKESAGEIKPGQQVKITGMLGQTAFIVEEI